MMCFRFKKSKSKTKQAESAPELRNQSRSENVSANRVTKSANSASSSRSIPELYKEREQNLRVFSYSELKQATNSFNRLLRIGEGGFGTVYKGTVRLSSGQDEPTVVAIKKLNNHGMQGHKEWLAEVHFLGVVEHLNLVKLLGYCSVDAERGIQRLLVYEYMPNKSLENHLFDHKMPVLPWKMRLQVMFGAAEGLAYLHEGMEVQVIFRDFKTSNVLLDGNFNPKLSDFGLAREGPAGDRSHVSTAPVGTYGYAAPEYVETGHLSVKSDIYAFGVVLYEILTGRRTIERDRPTSEQKLLEWVKQFPADSKRFYMIMDFRLRNQYSLAAARRVAKLADRCLNKNPKDRPDIGEIMDVLRGAILESEGSSSSAAATRFPQSPRGS
ncbi:hypothetical protein Nepgr_030665 [Nepenthes gracilis]|uniref:non-specific serine/threonine protein kinase n=1 Tax=Nepenthes gracilis TaxID=150966 RepID=A0AAD3TG60_NEPGR|nr:hypothetical protein Nepgr_030665 [Nepenthes gracilis]